MYVDTLTNIIVSTPAIVDTSASAADGTNALIITTEKRYSAHIQQINLLNYLLYYKAAAATFPAT